MNSTSDTVTIQSQIETKDVQNTAVLTADSL